MTKEEKYKVINLMRELRIVNPNLISERIVNPNLISDGYGEFPDVYQLSESDLEKIAKLLKEF